MKFEGVEEDSVERNDCFLQGHQVVSEVDNFSAKKEKILVKNEDLELNENTKNLNEKKPCNEDAIEVKESCDMLQKNKEDEEGEKTPISYLKDQKDMNDKIYDACVSECTDEWKTMEYLMSDDQDSEHEDHYAKIPSKCEWKEECLNGYSKLSLDDINLSDESLNEKTSYLFSQENIGNCNSIILLQMEFTKNLLSEEQRIAYVSLCKLVLVEMIQEISSLPLRKKNSHMYISAAQNMELWSQKILAKLYAHMDISPDEQAMIEQLSKHGVVVSDLTFILMKFANVNTFSDDNDLNYSDSFFVSDMDSFKNSSNFDNEKVLKLDIRWTVLCNLFLLLIIDSMYDSRSRVFLQRVGKVMSISNLEIAMFEKKITDELVIQENFEMSKNNSILKIRDSLPKNKRYMLMALATISGGLVIGLSSGILAPLIGAGLGAAFTTIGVAGTTGFLAGSGGAALITTGGVVTGSSIAVKKMSNRIKNIKTFEFKPLYDNKRLNLLITVPGWMLNKDDVRLPFSTIDPVMSDVYSVLWEPEILQSMGKTINILATEILTQSLQQVLGQTFLVTLMSALQWPLMLTKLGYLIDNPFVTSLQRAKAAGYVLADILLHRKLGIRPISLVGFSLGSRVIYYCLLELAKKHAYGIIENVYLFGTPVIINQNNWIKASSVVAGRFINGYITNDWVLGCLFRITYGGIGRIAGLQPIQNLPNIENLDLTDLVDGHMNYRKAIPKLMKKVGWEVQSEEFEEIEISDSDKNEK